MSSANITASSLTFSESHLAEDQQHPLAGRDDLNSRTPPRAAPSAKRRRPAMRKARASFSR
jgi:hypothetical protein